MSGSNDKNHNSLRNKKFRENDRLLNYISANSLRLHPSQQALAEATNNQPGDFMLSDFTEMQFLANLIKTTGAKKTLDVGVYSGYSALSVALALPEDGKVVAMDIDDTLPQIGMKYWKEAGVDQKIDFRLGPALESLQSLLEAGEAGTYDFAFIDADKENYVHYYELCLKLLRPKGIIALDNTLWQGKVADAERDDASTESIRELNRTLHNDQRIDISLLLLGDGTTLAFKR